MINLYLFDEFWNIKHISILHNYEVSGTFGINGGRSPALGKLEHRLSICMIVERESGDVINVQSLEKIASDLVFSHDENQLAYFLSSDSLRTLTRGHIHFMSTTDTGAVSSHPGIPTLYRSHHPNRMSFSMDGKLLSFACDEHVDLYDVDTATFLTRLDWKRISGMIASNDPRMHRLPEMKCSGAAFSTNGNELRLNVSPLPYTGIEEIAMIRIFDHPVMDAQERSATANNSERTTSATRSPQERLHAVGDASGDD